MRRDGKHAPSAHWPSSPCKSKSLAPHPSLAVLARSAATCSCGASVRSRMTCQRIAESESNSQSTTVTVFAELTSTALLLDQVTDGWRLLWPLLATFSSQPFEISIE